MIRPDRLARAVLADLLLTFAAWADRYDTRLADALNTEDDET